MTSSIAHFDEALVYSRYLGLVVWAVVLTTLGGLDCALVLSLKLTYDVMLFGITLKSTNTVIACPSLSIKPTKQGVVCPIHNNMRKDNSIFS